MAATSKSQLLTITRTEFEKLAKVLDTIDDEKAFAKDDDDTSIKDVIGHRAHWIDLFLGWHADGLAGSQVHMPAEGYKWNQLKEYNAKLREEQQGLSWQESQTLLQDKHDELMRFIEMHSEEELFGAPMTGADSKWTAGRFAEASGASHYRSASKYVRARLRSLA